MARGPFDRVIRERLADRAHFPDAETVALRGLVTCPSTVTSKCSILDAKVISRSFYTLALIKYCFFSSHQWVCGLETVTLALLSPSPDSWFCTGSGTICDWELWGQPHPGRCQGPGEHGGCGDEKAGRGPTTCSLWDLARVTSPFRASVPSSVKCRH